MAYKLGDVYIGNYGISQAFGANPQTYAVFGLKGHPGIDIPAPSMTLALSAANGFICEIGFDAGGYGNYIKICHGDYLTLYGHLNDILVKKGDTVVSGQLIGHTNNTGFSTGPHLHVGVAPCDAQGNKTDPNNGYSGYIDPMGSLCEWDIKNLTSPVIPVIDTNPPVQTDPIDLNIKTVQATDFITVVNFGLQNGLGVYLTNNNDSIDLTNNPADEKGGEKINKWISSLLSEIEQLKSTPLAQEVNDVQNATEAGVPTSQANFVSGIFSAIRDFIFVKK